MYKFLLSAIFCVISSCFAAADQVPFSLQPSATSLTAPIFDGTHMYLTASGSGIASHMGAITFTAPHDFDLANGTYISDAYIRAANGDVLHIVTLGQFISAVDSIGSWTIVGGTGRFTNATGSGTSLNLNFGASISYSGTISTVGPIDG